MSEDAVVVAWIVGMVGAGTLMAALDLASTFLWRAVAPGADDHERDL